MRTSMGANGGNGSRMRWRSRLREARETLMERDEAEFEARSARWGVNTFRFVALLFREFGNNQMAQRAASLTYTTILSLFPLLLLITSLASVFYSREQEKELIEYIEAWILPITGGESAGEVVVDEPRPRADAPEARSPRQPDVVTAGLASEPTSATLTTSTTSATGMASFLGGGSKEDDAQRTELSMTIRSTIREMSASFRDSSKGIGFVGLLGLMITAYFLYNSIEHAFAAAWETSSTRRMMRTLTGFTVLVVVAPIIITLSIAMSSGVLWAAAQVERSGVAGVDGWGLQGWALSLAPPIFNGLILAIAYMWIPQARVRLVPALIGGFVAGVAWEGAKAGFILYVYSSAMNRAIFQSLGAVPIFLIWVYFTWMIFLGGNVIVYVTQNYGRLSRAYFGGRRRAYLDGRLVVAMALLVAEEFERGRGPIDREQLGLLMRVPPREFERVLATLLRHRILAPAEGDKLTLARPADRIGVDRLLALGCDPITVCDSHGVPRTSPVALSLGDLQLRVLEAGRGRTLRDLLRMPAPGPAADSPVATTPPAETPSPSADGG